MSTQAAARARPSYVLAHAEVRAVDRVSPSFVRITFGGAELSDFGDPGDMFDARIKLIFPPPSGALPAIDRDADDWWEAYLAVPEADRGAMRTYSVRELRVAENGETEVVVDFVLHLEPGLTGPASRWASGADAGDALLIVGPRRGRDDRSGIEYAPDQAASVVLVGDETAAPAIARILEDAPRETRGVAFIEVPVAADILPIRAPAGVAVHWLPREGDAHGRRMLSSVLEHLGEDGSATAERPPDTAEDELVWETPVRSASERTEWAAGSAEESGEDRYFWIAGESGAVTTLRRHLVTDLGIARSKVAFMGYWRRGVAMRG